MAAHASHYLDRSAGASQSYALAYQPYEPNFGSGNLTEGSSEDFTVSTQYARLTYTGAATKKFLIRVSLTLRKTTSAIEVRLSVAKNTTDNEDIRIWSNNETSGKTLTVEGTAIYELAQNDIVRLYVRSASGTMNYDNYNMWVTELTTS